MVVHVVFVNEVSCVAYGAAGLGSVGVAGLVVAPVVACFAIIPLYAGCWAPSIET